jgi:hypothetical protein
MTPIQTPLPPETRDLIAKADGKRRFRTAYFSAGRKNGKTTPISGIHEMIHELRKKLPFLSSPVGGLKTFMKATGGEE